MSKLIFDGLFKRLTLDPNLLTIKKFGTEETILLSSITGCSVQFGTYLKITHSGGKLDFSFDEKWKAALVKEGILLAIKGENIESFLIEENKTIEKKQNKKTKKNNNKNDKLSQQNVKSKDNLSKNNSLSDKNYQMTKGHRNSLITAGAISLLLTGLNPIAGTVAAATYHLLSKKMNSHWKRWTTWTVIGIVSYPFTILVNPLIWLSGQDSQQQSSNTELVDPSSSSSTTSSNNIELSQEEITNELEVISFDNFGYSGIADLVVGITASGNHQLSFTNTGTNVQHTFNYPIETAKKKQKIEPNDEIFINYELTPWNSHKVEVRKAPSGSGLIRVEYTDDKAASLKLKQEYNEKLAKQPTKIEIKRAWINDSDVSPGDWNLTRYPDYYEISNDVRVGPNNIKNGTTMIWKVKRDGRVFEVVSRYQYPPSSGKWEMLQGQASNYSFRFGTHSYLPGKVMIIQNRTDGTTYSILPQM